MKLGISYIAFNGEELLEYAINPIRDQVDFISVIYQKMSYLGNPCGTDLLPHLEKLQYCGIIDELVEVSHDFSQPYKSNELHMRNLGLQLSKKAGCTHHISADVDEFYLPSDLAFAKDQLGNHQCSFVELENYFKSPTYRIVPSQRHVVSFIQSVEVPYDSSIKLPYRIDKTRQPVGNGIKFDFKVHHMSYVRKNMRQKLENTLNGAKYDIDQFLLMYSKYELGEVLKLAPDFINRRTVYVENVFNIPSWGS